MRVPTTGSVSVQVSEMSATVSPFYGVNPAVGTMLEIF
jgi:hypothetical protein